MPDSPGTTHAPYIFPANGDGVVIFGLLGPSMVEYIGQLSDAWMNVDKRFDTSAQLVDPLEALRQLLGACELDSRCEGRRPDYFIEGDTKRSVANRVYDSAVIPGTGELCKTCARTAEVAKATA